MRLHHLEITAFGPFADTVTVDFDALSAAGLFLLAGPTGAGKSSVLDAVCFALYGDVPGDRAAAKRLRCDTAADGVAPRVVLVATLGDRRFRLTRSPAWQRPKRRGTGLTPQQASVVVEELIDGTPRVLSTRLDEAGHLVSALLGMTLTQFCQVTLLPQGRFQEFLRARSEDRQRLLQQLFRTRRFEDVERWLADRRLELRREVDRHTALVDGIVHRVVEVAGVDLPEPTADDEFVGWATDLAAACADEARIRDDAAATAAVEAEAAMTALAEATELAAQQARHRAAIAARQALDAQSPNIDRLVALVSDARRAAPVEPLQSLLVRARRRRDVAASALAGLASRSTDLDELTGSTDQVRERLTAARALAALESDVATLRAEEATADREIASLTATAASLARQAAALPVTVTRLAEATGVAARAVQHLPAARERLSIAQARRAAAIAAESARDELARAQLVLAEFVDTHQAAREHWLDVQEARLHGMAGEMAAALAVGASCPVCGSCDHPQPAHSADRAPTAQAERRARKAVDDAEVARHAQTDTVRALETRIAVLHEQSCGADRDAGESLVAAAAAEVHQVEQSAGTHDNLARELADARAAAERIDTRLAETRIDLATAEVAQASRRARLGELCRELDAHLEPGQPVTHLVEALERRLADLTALDRARVQLERAEVALAEAVDDLARVAAEQGFVTPDEAAAAVLPAAELAAHETRVSQHATRMAATEATLADPVAVEAAARPAPDLAAVTDARATTAEAARLSSAAQQAARARAARLDELVQQLSQALAGRAPVRDRLHTLTALASLAEGKSADNSQQMRLSAYVLAWRLGQVVAAANARLAAMTDQRFALEHTSRRGAGETRGGLSLLVRDEWSGESRDPVTLSGGETFVVSLALALGLTDVVTHEAGGADIGTLFVDEGFGSLDAETLDDVMDTLDGLRDGGRAVGVVSHVPELRSRIPTQLRVSKSRRGSGVELVRADA